MNKPIYNTIVEYNYQTDNLAKPYDPYSNDFIREEVVKKHGEEKVELYRTLCKMGLEYEYIRKIGRVHYFGCTVDKIRSDDVVADKIFKELEPFAKRDYIMGAMVRLGKIDIMDRYNSNVSSRKAIFTYVALNEPGISYLLNNPIDIEFQEGGLPPELP